ncbi:allergen Arg r 1-like [Ornithodoros turicata]|uniref:allergen Arg r 1-like n=1 Tax=Ornithodoros turicata TaxID=34597 RepID=UPI003138E9E1
MLSLVVFLTGCFFVATVHAACKTGPFDAKTSIIGPGSGKYYLMKSTYSDEKSCLYVVARPKRTTFPTEYPFGYKENGNWVEDKGTVDGNGADIIDNDEKFGQTTTTLVYSDYTLCDVGLFSGKKVGGPHVELWKHSDANENSEDFKCCKDRYEAEVKKQGKQSDVREIGSDCDYPK